MFSEDKPIQLKQSAGSLMWEYSDRCMLLPYNNAQNFEMFSSLKMRAHEEQGKTVLITGD